MLLRFVGFIGFITNIVPAATPIFWNLSIRSIPAKFLFFRSASRKRKNICCRLEQPSWCRENGLGLHRSSGILRLPHWFFGSIWAMDCSVEGFARCQRVSPSKKPDSDYSDFSWPPDSQRMTWNQDNAIQFAEMFLWKTSLKQLWCQPFVSQAFAPAGWIQQRLPTSGPAEVM